MRARRNQLLAQWQWTVIPGSELSQGCQEEFAEFFRKLNRITVDFERPACVIWPHPPELAYKE